MARNRQILQMPMEWMNERTDKGVSGLMDGQVDE